MMNGSEFNFFEKLPEEVLQLIFAAIGDCKSLVHCMVVSKAFQGHASKVNALHISLPRQFPTYDLKIWNIYSMVKAFKALESLIVCVGQPKKEPPSSWARCMRYAEIGVSVEKFVFMAAKSGDFVEFDSSLGLRSKLSDDNASEVGNETLPNNKYKATTSKNINEYEVDPGLLVNDEIAFFDEDERESNNNTNVDTFTSRQEQESSLYTIRTSDSIRGNGTTLIPHLNIQDSSNINATPHNEINLEYEKGESSERSDVQDHREGQISLCKTTHNLPKAQLNEQNFHIPVINFHLKQVIAPSNDVLKRMVPVIVFAIVQGLDEFRDTIPNFVEKFVNLKRFVLVDIVESLTVHMREHQIQQVRTQRLDTISRLISESVANKNIIKTNNKSEKYEIDETKIANKNKKQIRQSNQGNEVKHVDEKTHLDANKNTVDFHKSEDTKILPLKLQIHEIRSKSFNSEIENKPHMFESCPQEERVCQTKPKIDETQTPPKCNQIIKSPISSSTCDVCQDLKSQGNFVGICWHHFPNGILSSIPSISSIKSNTLSCDLPRHPHVERLIGNWSCNDPSLKAWLKGKQSLAGPHNISQISNVEMEEVKPMPKEHKKIKQYTQIRTFEEIMASRLHDDLSKKLPNTSIVTNSTKINEGTLNRALLNSHVTFSNSCNFMPIKKNADQITPRLTTSIMKKPESSKNIKISESSQHVENSIEDGDSKLDSWEKPSSSEDSSRSSSTSLNSLRSENSNLNFEVRRFSTPHTKLYGKNQISFNKTKCLEDLGNEFQTHQLKYKSNYRKQTTLKESNSKYIGKNSFKRMLQKETSKRREGDRASRIANSRRYGNNCKSKSDIWTESPQIKDGKEENAPLVNFGQKNPKDFWNFKNKLNYFGNDIKCDTEKGDQNKHEDVKGKMIVTNCSNDENTTSCNEQPIETHDKILNYEQQDEANLNSINNEIPNITTLHESEQLSPVASNHNEQLNSIGFDGVVLVPYESDSTIVNNRLQSLCDLEDTNSQSQIPFQGANFINIEEYPKADSSPSLSPRDNDTLHNEVTWLGARAKERSGVRRFGRRSRARSLRREQHHAHAEREREARQERLREGIHRRQRNIEQEALFFDISFWRSDQVVTPNYVLSEVSMCIATHDAKPLTEEELEMLSSAALAGPLLAATVAYVNEQIGSHNL